MESSTHRPPYQYMLGQLKAARKAAGLTQAMVATRLDTTQTQISKIERGERRIDPIELAEFAALYHQDLEYFLLTPTPPAAPKIVELAQDDAAILHALAHKHGESETSLLRRALHALAREAVR